MKYRLFPFAGAVRLFLAVFLFGAACHREEPSYDPCAKTLQTDALWPAAVSRDWAPLPDSGILVFRNETGKAIRFRIFEHLVPGPTGSSFFTLPCARDPKRKQNVNFSTFGYRSEWINTDSLHPIRSVIMLVDVLLDPFNSQLDQLRLSDVLRIQLTLRESEETFFELLAIPILDRGYPEALSGSYRYTAQLMLGGQSFQQVFSNYENSRQITAYCQPTGLLALQFGQELFLR
ncbi:MAG TPA: hypothetical protein VFX48_06565 [Saprospiraceae bacterium]|nr:hypothetical protein [Saprospiraceae bacterium]